MKKNTFRTQNKATKYNSPREQLKGILTVVFLASAALVSIYSFLYVMAEQGLK